MIYPWMFDEIAALRPFAPAAHALAARDGLARALRPGRLAANEVPVAAAVYFDDMYVDAGPVAGDRRRGRQRARPG